MDGGGWASYYNSIELALWTALFGTIVVFLGAYLVEKGRGFGLGRTAFQLPRHAADGGARAWCSAWPTSSSSTSPATR